MSRWRGCDRQRVCDLAPRTAWKPGPKPFGTARDGTSIYYQDWGSGPAVMLSHAWPLNADMWEYQALALALADAGFRVIAHDRRGFGRSGKPWVGHDYDTFADDLAAVMELADVSGAMLVGFSMGGGEVARYLSRHGPGRVARAVLLAAVTPFMLHTADNPGGVPKRVFDGIVAGLVADRPGARLEVYAGAPHGLCVAHKDRLNADLIGFARG